MLSGYSYDICESPYHFNWAQQLTHTVHSGSSAHPHGLLITSGGNLGCVLVLFPCFFLLMECVEALVEVAVAAVFAVVHWPHVRGDMLVWQDDEMMRGICSERQ